MIIASFALNIGHLFQYKLNEFDGIVTGSYDYDLVNTYPVFLRNNSFTSIYSIICFIINYVIFYTVNTFIEVLTVRKLHQELIEKKHKLQHINNQMDIALKRKLEMGSKKENRAMIMVIANSFINFLFRLPEIFFFLTTANSLFKENGHFEMFIRQLNDFESFFIDVSYFMYILTFITNVAVYYFFNTNFKQAFKLQY
jgi:hypothetical protein